MNERAASSARRIVLGWLPALSYMTLIWVLSSGPISVSLEGVPFKDKGVHWVEYGVLAALNTYAIQRTWERLGFWRVLGAAFVLTFAWGYLDELHQAFVPGRNSDALDVLADTLGALAGATFAGIALRVHARLLKA